jgi:F420-0:gamma-glutamyl ligase
VSDVTVVALEGVGPVREGDDLVTLLLGALERQSLELVHHDLIVVTSKIVSKAEGRVVPVADTVAAKVALVEKHLLGGDCLNVGCVPSKAVIRASRAAYDARDAGPFGVQVAEEHLVHPPESDRRRRVVGR